MSEIWGTYFREGLFLGGLLRYLGTCFSKVPKSFRTQKAIPKISIPKFQELFFLNLFNMNKIFLHAKFHVYTPVCFYTDCDPIM